MPKTGLWMAPILPSIDTKSIKHDTRKPIKKPAIDGYVLKLNGRVVSDRKLQLRAGRWVADDLMRQGRGGGIAGLLLPSSDQQVRRLASDRQKYSLEVVRRRDGGRREALRVQAVSPVLLMQLIAVCPAQQNWKKKQFVEWLVGEIKIKGSAARNVIASQAPDLLKEMRGYGWWYRLIGAKKMSR
jgi:hypothetical protein